MILFVGGRLVVILFEWPENTTVCQYDISATPREGSTTMLPHLLYDVCEVCDVLSREVWDKSSQ